ncbi:hypothetical protein D3C72_792960 [compost metagenome]
MLEFSSYDLVTEIAGSFTGADNVSVEFEILISPVPPSISAPPDADILTNLISVVLTFIELLTFNFITKTELSVDTLELFNNVKILVVGLNTGLQPFVVTKLVLAKVSKTFAS